MCVARVWCSGVVFVNSVVLFVFCFVGSSSIMCLYVPVVLVYATVSINKQKNACYDCCCRCVCVWFVFSFYVLVFGLFVLCVLLCLCTVLLFVLCVLIFVFLYVCWFVAVVFGL